MGVSFERIQRYLHISLRRQCSLTSYSHRRRVSFIQNTKRLLNVVKPRRTKSNIVNKRYVIRYTVFLYSVLHLAYSIQRLWRKMASAISSTSPNVKKIYTSKKIGTFKTALNQIHANLLIIILRQKSYMLNIVCLHYYMCGVGVNSPQKKICYSSIPIPV